MQKQVQSNPTRGYWLVSLSAFLIAPFLTNDGVCLLFVELIVDAFESVKNASQSDLEQNIIFADERSAMVKSRIMPLETGDTIYFMLTLACSANIGSALTYTGNILFDYHTFVCTHMHYIYM